MTAEPKSHVEVIPMPPQLCPICGDEGPDHRTVAIDCMYDLSEAGLDELPRTAGAPRRFGARVCKGCRGDLIGALRVWRQGGMRQEVEVGTIPVRMDGATRMVTRAEYERLYPGRVPYEIKEP